MSKRKYGMTIHCFLFLLNCSDKDFLYIAEHLSTSTKPMQFAFYAIMALADD